VTWPLLSPTTFFVTIITTIGSLQAFTQFFTMTQGGPLGATTTASYLVYEMGFLFFHEGFASAIAVVMFLIIALLTVVQWKMSERRVHYQ
jgi:ABC-type sugar transport system permease subunit